MTKENMDVPPEYNDSIVDTILNSPDREEALKLMREHNMFDKPRVQDPEKMIALMEWLFQKPLDEGMKRGMRKGSISVPGLRDPEVKDVD